ncbi:MAG TPA: hypothetical protein VGH33_19430 [Isosphaeraceae bacterium]|jgi:hypothetical protein
MARTKLPGSELVQGPFALTPTSCGSDRTTSRRLRSRPKIVEVLVSARALREPIAACVLVVDTLRARLADSSAGDATVGKAAAYRALTAPIIATALSLADRAESCAAAIGRDREGCEEIEAIDAEGLALYAKVVLLEGTLDLCEQKALATEASARRP